jgi:hypothetical protein
MPDQYGDPKDGWTTGHASGYREINGLVARVTRNFGETEWSWAIQDLGLVGVAASKQDAEQEAEAQLVAATRR